jgi:diguanylate cyclase (GGDEF)-like protein
MTMKSSPRARMPPRPSQLHRFKRTIARLLPGARVYVFVLAVLVGTAMALQPGEVDRLLAQADSIKSAEYKEFGRILDQLAGADGLSASQASYLAYLQAWRRGYAGEYDVAIPLYQAVIKSAENPTLQFRATASMVNALVIARRYHEAFTYLDLLVERLPQISDKTARAQAFHMAIYLNNQVGQYEIAEEFSRQLISEGPDGRGECMGRQLQVESLYKQKRLDPGGEEVRLALAACQRSNEVVFGNFARLFAARELMDRRQYQTAADMLAGYYDEVRNTRYPHLIAQFEVALAEAYWSLQNAVQAKDFALRALDKRILGQATDPTVAAYFLLYKIAQQQGDPRAALDYHEKYAEADKQNFDDVSARSLAYQMARHQSIANKLQIEALNKQNQVLQLEQDLGAKAAETSRLYIAMLVAGLLLVFLWAFHTKRRQLHFRTLSQRDGLTQIANRPHFLELSLHALDDCKRTGLEAAAILFDLDHFKAVNDRHGHAAGDEVLRKVAAICATYLRPSQYFGRIGGEEFAILLVGYDEDKALQLAEQLRKAIIAANADGGLGEFIVSASFGVATTLKAGYELHHLLACADSALYKAKLGGRDRVAAFDGQQPARPAALHGAGSDRMLSLTRS